MIGDGRVVAVIPARGGSKSIVNKNIRLLCGKPLISWTIKVALQTPEIDRVIVSTDHAQIAAISLECGAEVMSRPPNLAEDNSLVIDAIRDVICRLRYNNENAEYMVLLEPTSPLRSSEDISNCLAKLVSTNEAVDSVATFKEADLNPHRAWIIENETPRSFIPNVIPWLPRQELPKAYQLNGAVYAFRISSILSVSFSVLNGKIGAVIMPRRRSVDIDDIFDFQIAEMLMNGCDEDNA